MPTFVGQVVAVGPANQLGDVSAPPVTVEKSDSSIMVTLGGRERCTVDPGTPDAPRYSRILERLRHARMPAYLDTDDITGIITRLLVRGVFQVHSVAPQPVDDRLEVDLRVSHAGDFVAVTDLNYQRIIEALRAAQRGPAHAEPRRSVGTT